MRQDKFPSRNFLISLICILFLILFAFLIISGYFHLKNSEKGYTEDVKDIIDQRMISLIHEMNIFPGGAGGDVLFLSRLSCLRAVAGEEMVYENELNKLGEDFLEFLRENPAYYQLRYINKQGVEISRAEFDGENYKLIKGGELRNKSQRYYFSETMSLDSGEVHISSLDLNVEDGKIENRGTLENPVYVPVIRFAAPIFDSRGNRNGIIISNVYADYFLDDVRRAQRDGETMFLVNEEGYYLAHPDRDKEFAFMFDEKKDNFYNDYPDIAEEILSDFISRRIETEDLIFSYRYIYPTIESFEVNKGSSKIFGENPEKNYFWILVSVSDKDIIKERTNGLKEEYVYFLLFSGLIILVIGGLIFVLVSGDENRKIRAR